MDMIKNLFFAFALCISTLLTNILLNAVTSTSEIITEEVEAKFTTEGKYFVVVNKDTFAVHQQPYNKVKVGEVNRIEKITIDKNSPARLVMYYFSWVFLGSLFSGIILMILFALNK